MIISLNILNNSIRKYKKKKKLSDKNRENYDKGGYNKGESAGAATDAVFNVYMIIISIIFVILELILLFYAINIALVTTKGGAERVVHIVLAIIFTVPYMLIQCTFNPNAIKVLRNEGK